MDENANPENRFEAEMTRKIDLIIQKLGEYDTRFDSVDKRFDNLEKNVSEIKSVQKEHSQSLKRLEDKTDSIAEVVVKHEIRITKAEQNIEDLRDGVH